MPHSHTHTTHERVLVSILVSVLVLALGFVVATVLQTTDSRQLSAQALGEILDINGSVQVGDAIINLDDGSAIIDLEGADDASATRPGGGGIATIDGNNFDDIATEGSIRTTIQNWVNFFLGFLSIIAMVALIFAGFQYVTAGGNDDQAGSARKSIVYVSLGIIIIFAAWALVNTLIRFGPEGSDLAGLPADTLTADVLDVAQPLPPAYWQYESNR